MDIALVVGLRPGACVSYEARRSWSPAAPAASAVPWRNRFAGEGMRVVHGRRRGGGARACRPGALRATRRAACSPSRPTSAKPEQVEALADRAVAEFGGVDVVCNNAGVAVSGRSWEHTLADWEWVLGVNLWGVIHGIRTFVPTHAAPGRRGARRQHGVDRGPRQPAVHRRVQRDQARGRDAVGDARTRSWRRSTRRSRCPCSVPGFVNTHILDSQRNRPGALRTRRGEAPPVVRGHGDGRRSPSASILPGGGRGRGRDPPRALLRAHASRVRRRASASGWRTSSRAATRRCGPLPR